MGEQLLTQDSLVPIMLKSVDRWDQVAAFVALTMRCKMETVWDRQMRPIATAIQHPRPDLAIPSMFTIKTRSHSRIKSSELTAANRRIANIHSRDLRMKSPYPARGHTKFSNSSGHTSVYQTGVFFKPSGHTKVCQTVFFFIF